MPFFTSLYLSFTSYNVLTPPKWIGLDNFRTMFFKDKLFWKSFFVTFKFALIQVPIKLLFSLAVALILSKNTKAISYYRAAFYIPSLMGASVAIALTWKQLFSFHGANSWGDFMGSLLYLNTPQKYTVAYALKLFSDTSYTDYGATFAMSVLSMIPILIIFFIFQKNLIEGISTSGTKG